MSAKPASLPQWATDGTNNTEPSLAQKQTGWTPGQDGVSDYDNWYKELVYRWCQYINDGVIDGDLSIDGNLDVTGEVTVGGEITAAGDVNAPDHKYTNNRTRWIPIDGFKDPAGAHAYQLEYWTLGITSNALHGGVPVEFGEHIKGVGVYCHKTSSSLDTITVRLWRRNGDGTLTQVGSDYQNNANNPGPCLVGNVPPTLDHPVGSGGFGSTDGVGYVITVQRSPSGAGAVLVKGAYIIVSRPPT